MMVIDGRIEEIVVTTISRRGTRAEVRDELYRGLGLEAPKPNLDFRDETFFPSSETSENPRVTLFERTLPLERSEVSETLPLVYLSAYVRPPSSKRPPSLSYDTSFGCTVEFGIGGTPRKIWYTLPLSNASHTLARVGLKPKDLLGGSRGKLDDISVEDVLASDRRWRVEWTEANSNPGEVNPAIPAMGYTSPDYCSLVFEKRD
ncbi:hypothetical protein EON79_04585 [bacterium]|nr:MAG: hypothetical protein EON79_04585 [bacterium]